MSSAQALAFGILWLSVVLLGALVLVLYREVERAYSVSPRQSGGLLSGVALPDLDIVEDGEVLLLPGLRASERFLLLFIKQSCDRCEELLKHLQSARIEIRPVVVVLEGRTTELRRALPPWIDVYEAAYPNDATRDFGITLVPLAYVASAGRVVATGSPRNREELSSLLEQVDTADSDVDASSVPAPESTSGIASGARSEA